MKETWSDALKNKTRTCAGDGAMLKNESYKFGFFSTRPEGGIRILGVTTKNYFPVPTDTVLAEFSDIEQMIAAGWVLD